MITKGVSYLPIIDTNNYGIQSYKGFYKREDIFNWYVKNPGKEIKNENKEIFKNKDSQIREIEMNSSFDQVITALKNSSAILIKNKNQFTHLITPRVVANYLESYAKRFMIFEELEKAIRERISNKNIDLNILESRIMKTKKKYNVNQLDFGEYETIVSKMWEELGYKSFDKKIITKELEKARKYRNDLMHFNSIESEQGLEAAKSLINFFCTPF
tara:strand:- start:370 stop:1014 length:645 start_codon:yes stop_codon:yes gene_type:complete